MKRHIGRIINTGQRCVVVYMQNPQNLSQALVIPTDSLVPRMEQAVMEVLESDAGQESVDLLDVLNRRSVPETGKSVAAVLHESKAFVSVPVTNVQMLPMPNMPFNLEQILIDQRRLPADGVAGLPKAESSTVHFEPPRQTYDQAFNQARSAPMEPEPDYSQQRYSQHEQNRSATSSENNHAVARNLIIEAEMLEAEARKKRSTAYNHAPELAPKSVSAKASPVGTEDYFYGTPMPSTPKASSSKKTTLIEAPKATRKRVPKKAAE